MAAVVNPDQLANNGQNLPPELKEALARADAAGQQVMVMSVADIINDMQGALLGAFNLASGVVQKKLDNKEELTVKDASDFLSAQAQAAQGMAALIAEQRAMAETAMKMRKAAPDSSSTPTPTGQYL